MKYVDFSYDAVIRETESAVLLFDGTEEYWVPKSVINDGFQIEYETEDEIEVAEWFAIQEGLI